MAAAIGRRVLDAVKETSSSYFRLVLLVGGSGSGKTAALRNLAADQSWPVLNVNLLLSERLLDLTRAQRPRAVTRQMETLVAANPAPVIVLDNIEMLFDGALMLRPLDLLQSLARDQTLVVSWSGTWDGTALTYAAPGHPEWLTCSPVEAIVVEAVPSRPSGTMPAMPAPKEG